MLLMARYSNAFGLVSHIHHLADLFLTTSLDSPPIAPPANIPTPNLELVMDQVKITSDAEKLSTAISKNLDVSRFQSYLDANPELTGSTSKYFENILKDYPAIKYLYDPFTTPRNVLNKFIQNSPELTQSTSEYFSKASNGFTANSYVVDTFKSAEASIKASGTQESTTSFLSKFFNDGFKQGVGKDVENYINANPELKKTTSEWVMEKYNTVLLPKTIETLDFLGKSPLAEDTRGLFGKTTSEFVNIFAEKTAKASEPTVGPIRDALGSFTNKVGKQLDGTLLSTSEFFTKLFSFDGGDGTGNSLSEAPGLNNDFGLVSSKPSGPKVSNMPGASTTSAVGDVLKNVAKIAPSVDVIETANGLVDSVNKATAVLPNALERAGTSFSAQLFEKGNTLATNVASGLENTGKGIGSIGTGIVEIGIPKVVQGAQQLADPIVNLDIEKVSTSVSSSLPSPDSLTTTITEFKVDPKIVNKFSNIGKSISEWRLFTDENHMENGYWENQIKNLAKAANDASEMAKEIQAENSK